MPVKFSFIIFLLLLGYTTKAQVSKTIKDDQYDSEFFTKLANAEFEKQESSNNSKVNENFLYLYEISVDKGIHIPFKNNYQNLLDGSLFTVQMARFFSTNERWGIRTGVSYSNGFSGSNYYLGFPLLISYRTTIMPSSLYFEGESFRELLSSFIIALIPRRFEFSLGPNIGYIDPDGYENKFGYKVTQRMALSIDASTRMTFKIWRFGIVVTPAVSYLATRNFKYYTDNSVNYYTKSQPAFFFKGTFGLSFRF